MEDVLLIWFGIDVIIVEGWCVKGFFFVMEMISGVFVFM